MEQSLEVKTYQVEYLCDECKIGTMIPTGIAFTSDPMQYEHKCSNPKCPITMVFLYTYPKLEYRLA